jgi:2-keto-4-pentenoate hydratase/2-oxohepta-3-ene-1,7-dioic acid hydratase (catechol pathway)
MRRLSVLLTLVAATCLSCSGCSPSASSSQAPRPANFNCLEAKEGDGRLLSLEIAPRYIYGTGLTYASHLIETGSKFDKDAPPPIFKKALVSLNLSCESVKIPDRQALVDCANDVEAGLGQKLADKFDNLPPLLDYEGELAFILLEDIDWRRIRDEDYSPRLGFFIANDISARSLAILGEGMPNIYDYWGASKSFRGFLPASKQVWIPADGKPDSIPCVTIATKVNGLIRQKQSVCDMVYTPKEILYFIYDKFPRQLPEKGDIILMGTPGGVALQVPGWKAWLANILKLDRFAKLSAAIGSARGNNRFLKPGDVVEVSGEALGKITVEITRE